MICIGPEDPRETFPPEDPEFRMRVNAWGNDGCPSDFVEADAIKASGVLDFSADWLCPVDNSNLFLTNCYVSNPTAEATFQDLGNGEFFVSIVGNNS